MGHRGCVGLGTPKLEVAWSRPQSVLGSHSSYCFTSPGNAALHVHNTWKQVLGDGTPGCGCKGEGSLKSPGRQWGAGTSSGLGSIGAQSGARQQFQPVEGVNLYSLLCFAMMAQLSWGTGSTDGATGLLVAASILDRFAGSYPWSLHPPVQAWPVGNHRSPLTVEGHLAPQIMQPWGGEYL